MLLSVSPIIFLNDCRLLIKSEMRDLENLVPRASYLFDIGKAAALSIYQKGKKPWERG